MRSLHHRARGHASEPSDAPEKDLQELCIMSARRGVEVADGIVGKVCKEASGHFGFFLGVGWVCHVIFS